MSLSSLDLNLLLVLDTVLRERSVAQAAQRLHVTPSAISNGLAKLRTALGDPLVTRRGRGIVPTPRAEELAPALARALGELERVVTRRPFDAATCTRTFTLAMADAGQIAWLPSIAAMLSQAMPLARLRVVGIESLLTLGDLGSGEIDLHFGVRATGPGIHADTLYDEPLLLLARGDHPESHRTLSRERLSSLNHVGVEVAPGRGFRDPLTKSYAHARLPRSVVMTVPTFAAAASVAAATDFVATLPRSLLQAQGHALGLVALSGPIPKHAVGMALCWHERTHSDPGAAAFRGLVRGAIVVSSGAPRRKRGVRV
ncbi:MAG: LysR family transcriptional regulator [Pseudomonadota bacterium]